MRRASSFFDIDQEPLFEPLAHEAEAGGKARWDGAFDELPEDLARWGDHEADELQRRPAVPGRRSRLLVAVAAIGALGFVGSRLTSDTEPPAHPRTGPDRSAVRAAAPAAQPSPQASRDERRPPGRSNARQAARRRRTHRERRASHTPRREPGRQRTATPARSAAPVPAPLPATAVPRTDSPAPERQGFTGEFF